MESTDQERRGDNAAVDEGVGVEDLPAFKQDAHSVKIVTSDTVEQMETQLNVILRQHAVVAIRSITWQGTAGHATLEIWE